MLHSAIAVISLTLLGCGGSDVEPAAGGPDPTTAPDPAPNDDDTDPSGDDGFLVHIDPESAYVTALCTIDISAVMNSDDPLAELRNRLATTPTADSVQADELATIVAALDPPSGSGDPLDAFSAITTAGSILSARCSS